MSSATTREVAATLRTAADLIDEHGWTQRELYRTPHGDPTLHYRPGHSMCALGAIRAATGDPLTTRRAALAESALAADIDQFVPSWNDHPDRTADQVTTQMRATAARLEKEAS